MSKAQPDLRERTRRAVQKEIAEAAEALFAERGFADTTIDDIAAAIGMSPRSVFRYFANKEELVLGKLDFAADYLLTELEARPVDEPAWEALRRMFDVVTTHTDSVGRQSVAEPMQRIIFDTPGLFATYLHKLQTIQDVIVPVLIARAQAAGTPYAESDPAPRAIVAAAFGCLVAAQQSWLDAGSDDSFAQALDRAMAAVAAAQPSHPYPASGRSKQS